MPRSDAISERLKLELLRTYRTFSKTSLGFQDLIVSIVSPVCSANQAETSSIVSNAIPTREEISLTIPSPVSSEAKLLSLSGSSVVIPLSPSSSLSSDLAERQAVSPVYPQATSKRTRATAPGADRSRRRGGKNRFASP